MTYKFDVEKFLIDFKHKLKFFDIIFTDRDKNRNALLELGITPQQRLEYIKSLEVENYSSGPHKDTNDTNMPDYWVYGKEINSKEVYIKINFGTMNNPVICMSFHIAEYNLDYPLKGKKE